MKKILIGVCIFFIVVLVAVVTMGQITEEYSVQNPSDPDIDKIIIIDRTTVEEIIVSVRALKQVHDEQKANVLTAISSYNDLLEQLNNIIDACGLPQAWKQQYIQVSYTPTKP